MNQVFMFYLDDWCAMYINGELTEENHSISSYQALMLVKNMGEFELSSYYCDDYDKFEGQFGSKCPYYQKELVDFFQINFDSKEEED